ncbi:MAG: DUF3791 domain-containing protein [Eubacteriales bacterium]
MKASPILLQKKYARIIMLFAEEMNLAPREALDFFYKTMTYQEMRAGIADMHCRSDLYLVEELQLEYLTNTPT